MKSIKLISLVLAATLYSAGSIAQTTVTFNYTGSAQTWTVPQCVNTITVVAKGGKGGGGNNGGWGASVTSNMTVTPGQVLQINVGGQGNCPTPGWNGGGAGGPQGNYGGQLLACGGGGASDVRITPYALADRVIVAGGGGGRTGGDNWTATSINGGNGGCPNGLPGGSTYGQGGQGGTTVAGGAGGAGWGMGQAGFPGVLAVGGQGGMDNIVIYAAGGGGGGGLYGGGGGGADGCCIGANGGGAGGGGSSLVPFGGSCSTGNTNDGIVTITYVPAFPVAGPVSISNDSICNGDSVKVTINNSFGSIQWLVSTDRGNTWNPIPGATDSIYQTPALSMSSCYKAEISGCNNIVYSSVICVTVSPVPIANFTATYVCFGTPTNFVNTSNNNGTTIANYSWDINNDGIIDYNVPNFSHTFAIPGIYTSCLTLTTTDGCTNKVCKTVVVNPMPIADFTANNVCDGLPVSFFNTSNILSGTIDVYDWQFGDGNTSNLVNPVHQYAGPGLYNVTITVTSDSGCTTSLTKTIQIYANPSANFNAPNKCLYDAVNFFDQSTVGNASITTWNWNFGDNNTSNVQHPTHQYSFYNNYQVQLIVESSQGCKDTITKVVVVHPVPTALFTANNVCLGEPTVFNNLSTIPQGNQTAQWYFGDGYNDNNYNTTHTYQQPGNFIPYLVSVSDSGCVDTAFLNIEVWAIPEPAFSLNNTCENDTVVFTDLSSIVIGNITGWEWIFGNGSPMSNQQNPINFYYTPGSYTVTLSLVSDKGCKNSLTKQIDIFPKPKVEFIYSDELVGCSPLCVNFFDQTTINSMYNSMIQNYLWNFGDNISSIEKNPVHCFVNRAPEKKVFSVELTVTSNLGCKGYYIVKDLVDVYPQPTAEFTFNPYATTILNPNFKFYNHSYGYDKVSWHFGDGNTSDLINPSHTYGDTGTFNVTLVVENEHGCTDTVVYSVTIRPEFQFYIPNAFTPNGDGINDTFNGIGFGFDLSSDINQYNMKIYDRWGELIFETNDLANGWDGSLNGKKLESEAFVYSISITDTNAQKHTFRGTVTLVR